MKDRDSDYNSDEPLTLFRVVEQRITPGGKTQAIIESATFAKDKQTAREAEEEFGQINGLRKLTDREQRSVYAFSSDTWNSPWNPPHKPINYQPSKDPQMN